MVHRVYPKPTVADMQWLQGGNRHDPHRNSIPDLIRVTRDLCVLLCCPEGETGCIARQLTAIGPHVDIITELFTALAEVIDDPANYSALVLNCDALGIGGLAGGHRAIRMLGDVRGRIPVILVASECITPCFPLDRLAPVELPAPASLQSLQAGLEHALHDRLAYHAA